MKEPRGHIFLFSFGLAKKEMIAEAERSVCRSCAENGTGGGAMALPVVRESRRSSWEMGALCFRWNLASNLILGAGSDQISR